VVCTTGVDSNTCRMKFIQRTQTILTSTYSYWIQLPKHDLAKIKRFYLWKPSICKTFWTTLVHDPRYFIWTNLNLLVLRMHF